MRVFESQAIEKAAKGIEIINAHKFINKIRLNKDEGEINNLQKEILTQAVPATISMMFIGLGVFVLLFYVSTYGDYSAGGYGAAIRFEQLFLLPVLGLN